jgi:hypothetical protein
MTQAEFCTQLGEEPNFATRIITKGETGFKIQVWLKLLAWLLEKDE